MFVKTQDDKTRNISILDEKEKLNAIAELASGEITDESLKTCKAIIKRGGLKPPSSLFFKWNCNNIFYHPCVL